MHSLHILLLSDEINKKASTKWKVNHVLFKVTKSKTLNTKFIGILMLNFYKIWQTFCADVTMGFSTDCSLKLIE